VGFTAEFQSFTRTVSSYAVISIFGKVKDQVVEKNTSLDLLLITHRSYRKALQLECLYCSFKCFSKEFRTGEEKLLMSIL
jgi:hypothetical protein